MRASDLVARFGGHPVGELGIDLEASDGPGRWLVAACLYGGRIDAERALAAARALDAAGLADPKLAHLHFPRRTLRRIARFTRRSKRTTRRPRGATRQPGTGIRRCECRGVLAPASRSVGPGSRDSAAPGRAHRGTTPRAVGRRAGRGRRTGCTARHTSRRPRAAFARRHRICAHDNRESRVFEKSSESLPSRRCLSPACHRFADPGVERKRAAHSLRVGSKPPMRVIVDRLPGVALLARRFEKH